MSSDNYYVVRSYRTLHAGSDLRYFRVRIRETDLAIGVDNDSYSDNLMALCETEIRRLRSGLEAYIDVHPEFRSSLGPLDLLPGAPPIAVSMGQAGWQAGVGPMAAVAGAFAEAVGLTLRKKVRQVIVENGGDIYMDSSSPRLVSIFAGHSSFSHRIALRIHPDESPFGICTSSGTVGPSLSFGKADAVVVKGRSTALVDAVATGAANRIQTQEDFMTAFEYAQKIPGITGILAIAGEHLAAWGNIELVPL
ncbi:MAG: UPF0280 family protein [Syntrophomonadaceae bacterium]|nr:UPF0280 family protein [Syntrophomonadaceae bacterium]